MFPQAIFVQLFPLNSEKTIFDHFHNGAHPGRLASCRIISLGLCGAVFPAASPPGSSGVWPASGARSTTTHAWSPNPSPSFNGIFLTSLLIRRALCSKVIILITFLLLLIVYPNGWKLSLFQKHRRWHAQRLYVLTGFLLLIVHPDGWNLSLFQKRPWWHAQRLYLLSGFLILECSKRSLLIVGHNLLPAFDFSFAKCLTFHTYKQQLITLSRMA
jgi:hypothetical protein